MELSLHAKTRGILERYHLQPQKKRSQNFLVDENVFDLIIQSIQPQAEDSILEIGAGLGLLTEALSQSAGSIIALEVDPVLCEILNERFQENKNISVVCEDILKFNPADHFQNRKFKAVGNLPYHLSGLILRWSIDHRSNFSNFYFMLQKEVAERIVAKPSTPSYGVLSLLCQYFTEPKLLFKIPANSFLPAPKVESAFIELAPKPEPWIPNPHFTPLVKQSFSQRRKTLFNNLKSWKPNPNIEWQEIFEKVGITGKERAEQLPLETFIQVAELLTVI